MGFTPLTGVTMATRSGDVDVELVTYMMKKLNITDPEEMISILTRHSGLLGISGISSDMRDVIAAKDAGNNALRSPLRSLSKYRTLYRAILRRNERLGWDRLYRWDRRKF